MDQETTEGLVDSATSATTWPATSTNAPSTATPAEIDDLEQSLAGLAGLMIGRGQDAIEAMLQHVAEFAVKAIPGADGAGLTVLEGGRPETVVASADFVAEVERIQYGLGEGPCITAAAEVRTVRSGSLQAERQWPRFSRRVEALGVHSVVSLPLLGPEGVVGAMNVYARAEDAFDDRAVRLGEYFAVPAGVSVQNARALAQARRLATRLQTALTSRAVIDYALGVMMSRSGATAAEAYDRLQQMSRSSGRPVGAVAQDVVDQAVERARARTAAGGGGTRPPAV